MKVRYFINMQHLRSGLAQDKYNDCAKLADYTCILTSIDGKLTKYTGRHTCSKSDYAFMLYYKDYTKTYYV